MINPTEKLHIQYLQEALEHARKSFDAMCRAEEHMRGYLDTNLTHEWIQLKGHVAEGVHGLQVFTMEVKK